EKVGFSKRIPDYESYDLLIIPKIIKADAFNTITYKTYIKYKISLFESDGRLVSEFFAQSYGYDVSRINKVIDLLVVYSTGFLASGTLLTKRYCKSFSIAQTKAMNDLVDQLMSSPELMAYVDKVKGRFVGSVPKKPANLIITALFRDDSGDNILEGFEKGKLIVSVKNTGPGVAHEVTLKLNILTNNQGLYVERELPLGDILPAKEIKKEIDISTDKFLEKGLAKIRLEAKEIFGFDAEPVVVAFKTKEFQPPKIIVADLGISDFNDNAKIEPQEIVNVAVRIQNVGRQKAMNVKTKLILGENVFLTEQNKLEFELGELPPGEYKDIKFSFFTNKRIKGGERIPIDIAISEKRAGLLRKEALNLVMAKVQKRIKEIIVEAKEEKLQKIKIAKGLSIDIDVDIPKGKPIVGENDVAVIIANKNYKKAPTVKFAIHDGNIVKKYFIKTLGFREENIIYQEDAHLGDFNTIFGTKENPKGKLYNWVEPDSRVFIYYTGHGAPDSESGNAYFVPVEADPQYIATSGYSFETFKINLAKLPAKEIIIILDCCFSGSSAEGIILRDISPLVLVLENIYVTPQNKDLTMFLSAKANQVSTWYPEKRHSLFTYYFLRGLKGEADKNKDKKITIAELKEYLDNNIPRMARRLKNIEQTPVVVGKTDKVLAVLE
ncbi:MAG: hypothetical protein DRN81_06550, partial [Thermoproteota archaeon]